MAKSLDGVLTKKAHTKETFSESQVQDLLMCADPKDGYMYFLKNFFHIQHPTRGKVKFEPYTYQDRLLRGGYKCVVFSDTDEIIIANPLAYKEGLKSFLEKFAAEDNLYYRVVGR